MQATARGDNSRGRAPPPCPLPSTTLTTSHQSVDLQDSQHRCSSGMGLLLLLTCTLLSSCRVVDAQRNFAIRSINLFIEPSVNVTRGTNVTVRCKAVISTMEQERLTCKYILYKDNNVVYTKTSITSEDFLYPLPDARLSNTGKYRCAIRIEDKEMKSDDKKLTVTGLSKPLLHLNNTDITEGDEVTAKCEAPNETGSIFFYFYEGSRVIMEGKGNANQLEAKLSFSSVGTRTVHCTYSVFLMQDIFKSEESDTADVTVRELSITLVLEIYPPSDVYEGDRLDITCSVRNHEHSFDGGDLYLSQGTKLLVAGASVVNYTMVALSHHSGDFECRLEMGRLEKVISKQISVTELYSVPKLTISPAEVFQGDYMTLTCKSDIYAPGRINSRDLVYSLSSFQDRFTTVRAGVFSGRTLSYEVNYTCAAQAKEIRKESETLTVRPKVSVSTPEISMRGLPVVGGTIEILCHSASGSLPINYTLLNNDAQVQTVTVKRPLEKAAFQVTITSTDEIINYTCQAKNTYKQVQHSKRLEATVIVPLTKPTLIIHPKLTETYEGNELLLICSITGSPPVTYKWYHNGNKLKTNTSNQSSMGYHVERLNKGDSGSYHCEAGNKANIVTSDTVTVEVFMAMWKRGLIGGVCVLLVVVLVVIVLYSRSKRGKREAPAELSVKPSSPKSDDSLTENLTHITEVYNAATVGVDRAVVSVWTERPPDADDDDDVSNVVTDDPDVEYTEVVHPQSVDPARVPLKKGTDTVYSELKNSPHGAADHHDYGSLEYAELNTEQPENRHYSPEVNNYQELPVPVD